MSEASAPGEREGGGTRAGPEYVPPQQTISVPLDHFSQFEGQMAQSQAYNPSPAAIYTNPYPHLTSIPSPVDASNGMSAIASANMSEKSSHNTSHTALFNSPSNNNCTTLVSQHVSNLPQEVNMSIVSGKDSSEMDVEMQGSASASVSTNRGIGNKRSYCDLEDNVISTAPATGTTISTSPATSARMQDGSRPPRTGPEMVKSRRLEGISNAYSKQDAPPYIVHVHALGNNRSNLPHPMRMFAQVGRIMPPSDIAEMKKLGIDSRSVLMAIASPDHSQGNYIIHRIKQNLIVAESGGRSITLCWIPAHKGIPGNEKADRLAKMASLNGSRPAFFDIPFTDLQFEAKAYSQRSYKQHLEEISRVKGIQYSELYLNDSSKPWFCNKGLNREEIVCVSRIRSNHYNLNYSLYRKNIVDSPECPCGETRQDINHVVFYCRLCIHKSVKLRNFIKKNFPTYSIDIFPMLKDPSPRFCSLLNSYLKSLEITI